MDDRRLPPEYLSRYSGAASRLPQLYPIEVPKTPETPVVPASESPQRKPTEIPWYNPQGWSFRKRLIAVCAIVIIIVVVVVGTVEGVRANRYPNYTPLTYQLRDTYAGPSFFDQFRYFSDADPTDGFVVYVNKKTAQDLNLTYATESSAVLRVDSFTPNAIAGRNSVRVESLHTYDTGLFIFDIIHTPHGCATWPALWLTDGDNWPNNGEIDILESNNEGSHGNEVTLHTTPGCRMDVKRKGTGDPRFVTCDNSTHGNAGCGVQGDPSTYGHLFNVNGGGVCPTLPTVAGLSILTRDIRSTHWNSAKKEFEPGSSLASPSHPISASRNHPHPHPLPQTQQPGVYH